MTNSLDQFKKYLVKLEPIEFFGLTKILCIPILDENNESRKAEDLILEMIDKFSSLGRKQKREILSLLRKVIKHGSGTKN